MSKDNVTRRISIFVNGKEVENSLKGVEGAMTQVRNKLRGLKSDSETYDKDSKELAQTMNQLRERQAAYREELGLTNKVMQEANEVSGGLRGTLTGIWDSLVSGDLQGAKEGIGSLTSGMGGLLKSSLAFVATPIGAAIAGLAGLAAGAKAMFDFNVNAEKGAQLIENLSGKTGQAVEDIRIRIQSLTDTFGIEFEALAGAVDNLVDTGVAKDELEALDKIKQGLLTAPDKNEFISSLENSAVTAKQVGLDLEEVIALKKSIEETGVNPEATFGALEKAGKNLALQTDNLRNSLSSAFGAAFTDDVLAKVKTGQITTVQALDLINTKSKEVGLNQTQQAELGAQLFGKSAQSAGGFATILDTVSSGLQKQNQELNSNQKAVDELENANLRLGTAQSELFRVKNFGEIWTGIKAKATDFFASTLEWIANTKKDIQPLIDFVGIVFANAWEYLKTTVGSAFDFIGGVLRVFSNSISTIFNFIKKVFQGDFSGAIDVLKQGFINLGNIVGDTFGKIQNRIINALKAIVDNVAPFLEAIGMDVDKIQKKLDSFKNKEVELKSKKQEESNAKAVAEEAKKAEAEKTKALKEELAKQAEIRAEAARKEAEKRQQEAEKRKQEAEKRKAAEEKEAKEAFDRAVALAKAKQDLAKAQLDAFLANQRSYIDKEKALTPEILAMEEDRLDTIRNKKNEFALNEYERKKADLIAKAELDKTSQEQLNIELETLSIEYNQKKLENDLEFQKLTEEQKKQYLEEQKVLKAEQLMADYELEVAEAETKYQAELIRKQKAADDEIKILTDKKNKGIINEDEYKRFVIAAQKEITDFKRQQTLSDLSTGLGALNNLAGAMGELFGQSKELAITQAIINGALAVTSILSAASMGNPILDAAVKAVSIAAAVATTLANVNKIKNAKPPKKANLKADTGFYYGGFTGSNPALGSDEYGPVTGYVHKNEYVIPEVMTQDPQFANTIGWLEANRQKKMKGYADGGATTTGMVPAENPQVNTETAQMNNLLVALLNRLDNPIAPNLIIGYNDVEKLEDMKKDIYSSSQNGIIG